MGERPLAEHLDRTEERTTEIGERIIHPRWSDQTIGINLALLAGSAFVLWGRWALFGG